MLPRLEQYYFTIAIAMPSRVLESSSTLVTIIATAAMPKHLHRHHHILNSAITTAVTQPIVMNVELSSSG